MKKKIKKIGKKRWIIIGTVVVVFIAGVFLLIRFKKRKMVDASVSKTVLSAEVTKGNIESGVSGTGTLAYGDTSVITVPEDLEIDEVLVSVGNSVSAGTLLATVDQASLAAGLAEVQEAISDVDSTISTEKSKSESTKITAGVAGRVKELYVEEDKAVSQTMKEHGALMILSTDGYMAVDLESADGLNVGDDVLVSNGDTTADGTVSSVENGTTVIVFSDSKYDVGEELTVMDSDDNTIGKASAYVHAPLKVVGTNGTVSTIPVSVGSSVSASTTVVTLKETAKTAKYQQAVKEREELVETLNTLILIQTEGGIVAQNDGVVETINTDTGLANSGTNSSSQNSISSASVENSTVKVSSYDVAEEKEVEKESTGSVVTVNNVTGVSSTGTGGWKMMSTNVVGVSQSSDTESNSAESDSTGTKDTESISAKTALEAPQGLSGGEGVIAGTTTAMEYAQQENAAEWKTCTDKETAVLGGTWYVRYKETQVNAASAAVKVEVREKAADTEANSQESKTTENANGNVQNADNTTEQTGNDGKSASEANTTSNEQNASKENASADSNKQNTTNGQNGTNTATAGGSVKSSGSAVSSGSASSSSSSLEDTDSNSMKDVFTIASGNTMTVSMTVDELDILSMKEGQEAVVSVDALEGKTFSGSITSVSGSTSGSGGVAQYSVEVTFEKTEDMLEGMSASVEVILEKAEDVLVVPISAVSDQGRRSVVYTSNEDGTLGGEVEIETGLSDETYVEVKSGLSEGDTIYYQMLGSEDSSNNQMGGFGNFNSGGMPGAGFNGEKPDRSEMKGEKGSYGGGNPGGGAPGAGGGQQ